MDALGEAARLGALPRQILRLFLERLALLDQQIEALDKAAGEALRKHPDAVQRLAEMPGLGADSVQQIIAEVGPEAATFPSAGQLASWVGGVSWTRRKRGGVGQQPVPERQPAQAPDPHASGSRRGPGQGPRV